MIRLVSRIDDLRDELQTCTSAGRRKEIVAELKQLRREQSRLSLTEREPKAAPLPPSYIERVKADRKMRARLSGRDKIRVHFVQGGAPGSAK